MNIPKLSKLMLSRKIIGLVVGFIGLISSLIGIYAFFDQSFQGQKFTLQVHDIKDCLITIVYNGKKMKVEIAQIQRKIENLSIGIEDINSSTKATSRKQIIDEKIKSVEFLASKIEQRINSADRLIQTVKLEYPKETISELEEIKRRLQAEKTFLDVQILIAEQLGEQFKKMKESSIKRLKIDV